MGDSVVPAPAEIHPQAHGDKDSAYTAVPTSQISRSDVHRQTDPSVQYTYGEGFLRTGDKANKPTAGGTEQRMVFFISGAQSDSVIGEAVTGS